MAGMMPTAAPAANAPPAGATNGAPVDRQAQMQGGADDTVPDEDNESPNVTPEEQQEYEAFVMKGFELLYAGGKVKPEILKMLDDDPTDLKEALGDALKLDEPADPQDPSKGTVWDALAPVIALAACGAIITVEVLKSYPADQRPDGAIVLHGGKALLEEIGTLAEQAKIHDYNEDEMAEAFRRGADLFRADAEAEGLIDVDQAKAEFGEIVQADKAGTVNQLLPGIEKVGPPAGDQVTPAPGDQGTPPPGA